MARKDSLIRILIFSVPLYFASVGMLEIVYPSWFTILWRVLFVGFTIFTLNYVRKRFHKGAYKWMSYHNRYLFVSFWFSIISGFVYTLTHPLYIPV